MGVLVSGQGTNLRALVRASEDPAYPARVVAVGANRVGCPALEAARQLGIPAQAFPISANSGSAVIRDSSLAAWLLQQGCELLVLAGYDRILTAPLIDAFPERILNIHNSLLPSFAGTMRAVEEALEYGVKITGCTVHLVDPKRVDGGPIVLQAAVRVEDDDTPNSLLERIHQEEWRILPEAVGLVASGRLRVEGRVVRSVHR